MFTENLVQPPDFCSHRTFLYLIYILPNKLLLNLKKNTLKKRWTMQEIISPLFLNIQSSHCNALNENLFYLDYPNIVENCRHYLGLCLGINICWMVWWFQGKWINMFAKCLTKILARSHSQIMSAAKVGRVGKWWKTLTKGRSGVRKSADKRW